MLGVALLAVAAVVVPGPTQAQARELLADVGFGNLTVYGCARRPHDRWRCFAVEREVLAANPHTGAVTLETNVREHWSVWRAGRQLCAKADEFASEACEPASSD